MFGVFPASETWLKQGTMFPYSSPNPTTFRNRCPTVMRRDMINKELKYQPAKDQRMPTNRTNLDQLVVAPWRLEICGLKWLLLPLDP